MSAEAAQDYILEPVTGDNFISSLRNLITILKSCIGPEGKPKLLVTSGNYVQLTSCSATLVDRLDMNNPICRYILQLIKAQTDFGLYLGTIIASVLEQVWMMQAKEQTRTRCILESIKRFVQCCNTEFMSAESALDINFNSASDLLCLAKNILLCKSFLNLSKKYIDDLSINVVKAFLMSINTSDLQMNRVLVKAEQGSDYVNCYNGILYQIFDREETLVFNMSTKFNYSVLLFSTYLTCDEKLISLDTILQILHSAIERGVHIVACQKVVHSTIKLLLERNGILLLERMGTEKTEHLREMSKAVAISDLSTITNIDIESFSGRLTSVDVVKINEKKYVLLENSEASITTMYLCTSSLAGEHEVKIVVEQALETLRSISKDPRLIPGAGCFEVSLLVQLLGSRKFQNNVDKFILNTFKKSLISALGIKLPVLFDTIYNHAWASADGKCNCGLLTGSVIVNDEGDWLPLEKYFSTENINLSECNRSVCKKTLSIKDGVHLDSFVLKRNAFMSALESCQNLLTVGSVVYKQV